MRRRALNPTWVNRTPSLAKVSSACAQPYVTYTPFVAQGMTTLFSRWWWGDLIALRSRKNDVGNSMSIRLQTSHRLMSLPSLINANYWTLSRTMMTSFGIQTLWKCVQTEWTLRRQIRSLPWSKSLVRHGSRNSWGAFVENWSTTSLHRSGPCPQRSYPWSSISIEWCRRCRITTSHLGTILLKSKQPSARS
jgi:hypothetical protein